MKPTSSPLGNLKIGDRLAPRHIDLRYSLRTLLTVLALGPMILAMTHWAVRDWQCRQAEALANARAAAAQQLTLLETIDGYSEDEIQCRPDVRYVFTSASPP